MMNRRLSYFEFLGRPAKRCGLVTAASLFCSILSGDASAQELKYNCPDLATKAELTNFGQSAYQGRDGWFFRSNDFNHLYPLPAKNAAMLKKLKGLLELKGTKLVMIPLPSRGVMAEKFLLPDGIFENILFDKAFAEQEFKKLVHSLKDEGFLVVDVLDYFEKHQDFEKFKFYFSRDIHWTPQGAFWTAKATSEFIKGLVQFSETDTKNFTSENTRTRRVLNSGTNLAINEVCKEKIPHEEIELYETKNSSQTIDAFLADDTQQAAAAILLGTSFSAESLSFHFSGFLRSELQTEVVNFALTNGGMDQAMFDWVHGDTWPKSPPKVVFWELPFIDRLPNFPEQSERQILPALGGLCANSDNEIQTQGYTGQNLVTMKVEKSGVAGANFYLSSDLSDPTIRVPRVKLTYADGQVEEAFLKRPERVVKAGKLFWELSDQYVSGLKTIEIGFETNKLETGTLSLCQYPKGITPVTTN
jgi:alginate biosynthesis protein AlgX